MTIKIADIADPKIADFLGTIDRSRAAKRDGEISRSEANMAARRLKRDSKWRKAAEDAFGVAPRTGAEVMRFVERPPREEALERILALSAVAGRAEMVAGGRGQGAELADGLSITRGGRIAVDGVLPRDLGSLSEAVYGAAKHAGALADADLNQTTRRRLFGTLSDAITVAQTGRRSAAREQLFAGALTLMMQLARSVDDGDLRMAIVDRVLQAITREEDPELKVFYMAAAMDLGDLMDPAQSAALKSIQASVLTKAPPVEGYTKDRTKPLKARMMVHEEFWKEELALYDKSKSWELVKKNRKDTRREYRAVLEDPTGKKKPLRVSMVVEKGELDFLEHMADPKTHVVMYSGHSALGGNGSQAVADAEPAQGEHPKTVLIANCRGKDNYAEFHNKFPGQLLITTDGPTYSSAGEARVMAMWDMLARGESFAYMRKESNIRFWDERADNYIYPDEMRRFRFLDADEDGKSDWSRLGRDKLFDVGRRQNLAHFTRAVAFVNTELYYHWEIELENGKRSTYGRSYYDNILADGVLKDPRPGEIVRVTPETHTGVDGKERKLYRVQADPADVADNRDLYAGVVTSHVMMALAREKFGELSRFETLRAVLMGAQAIHYLDVYTNTAPETMRAFFREMGLGEIDPAHVEEVFAAYDAHASTEQVQAFEQMLEQKYPKALAAFRAPEIFAESGVA